MNEVLMRQLRERLDRDISRTAAAEISESTAPEQPVELDSEEEREIKKQKKKMVKAKSMWQEVGKVAAVKAKIRESTIQTTVPIGDRKTSWQDDKEERTRMFIESVLEKVETDDDSDEELEVYDAEQYSRPTNMSYDEPDDFASRMRARNVDRVAPVSFNAKTFFSPPNSLGAQSNHDRPDEDALVGPVPESVAKALALDDSNGESAEENPFRRRVKAAAVKMSVRRLSALPGDQYTNFNAIQTDHALMTANNQSLMVEHILDSQQSTESVATAEDVRPMIPQAQTSEDLRAEAALAAMFSKSMNSKANNQAAAFENVCLYFLIQLMLVV